MKAVAVPGPEVAVRSGLPASPSKVAYLGASVTQQEDGYRPRLHEMLERRLERPIEQVAAGLGAMDAASVVFLTDDFVVTRRPDICFVDLTSCGLVEERSIEEGRAALDGILAKLRDAGIAPCLVHLPRRERSERFAALIDAYERVAEAFEVPSIDLATPIADAIARGELQAADLIRDEVHSTGPGSTAYAAAIDAAIGDLLGAAPGEPPPVPAAPELAYRNARFAPVDPGDGGRPGSFRLAWPLVSVDAGSSVARRFEGRVDGLVLVIGPHSGAVEVTDARGSQQVKTSDRWSHFERFGSKLLPRRLEPGEVTVRPAEAGTELRLIGYLELP